MSKLIIGNLKMNILSPAQQEQYLSLFKKELTGKKINNCELILCPPTIHLPGFQKAKIKKIILGAQNMFWEEKGSYTGEISPTMLKNFGCAYVILGHSERRRYFCERDEEVNLKVISALKNGLKPVLCVGEDGEQKKEGSRVVLQQLENCLADISRGKIENVVICYEPVWAISSNNPDHLPSANEIMSAKLLIRKFLVGKYGVKFAEKVKIIYGGSVSANIVKEVCLDPGMDGVLIGRESLVPHEFVKIAKLITE
ncbi:MAG: triose-phosphate isomerase [Parcubacteria group bacterium]|jgi:triosephosphate isomerase